MFKNLGILRELLKVIHKFQLNFTIRHILACNNQLLLQQYTVVLFNLSNAGLGEQTLRPEEKKALVNEVTSIMNVVWQRIHLEML